eukprot:8450768-Prorocentrum_lima.AAC.1
MRHTKKTTTTQRKYTKPTNSKPPQSQSKDCKYSERRTAQQQAPKTHGNHQSRAPRKPRP